MSFNEARVVRNVAFIEKLKITIGGDAGKQLLLRPWQRKFISDVYGPTRENGLRLVRRAINSLPRKQGKSELSAAIVLLHLIGPESEANGEIYSAANDRQQASIIFKAVKRFIEASPSLYRYLRVVDSTKTIYVTRSDIKARGSVYRALSADAGRQHGLNPSVIVVDELAQAKSRELFDTLATSQGARAEPLMIVISTQSHDPTHILSEMIDDGLKGEDPTTVCHLYSAPDGCDVMDEEAWHIANPALGDFLDEAGFRADAERAKRLPSEEQAFRLLRLNQRVAANAALIARADWAACLPAVIPSDRAAAPQFDVGESIYGGLDLSQRTDLSALVWGSAERSLVITHAWKPRDLILEHAKRDGAPYDVWERQGWLTAVPGRSIDPAAIAGVLASYYGDYAVRGLAYDRYKIDELLRSLDSIGLQAQQGAGDGLRLEAWGQGFASMGVAVDAFEQAVLEAKITTDGNPVLTWNVANAQVIQDPAGNRKLDKSKSRFRIDAAVALAMMLGLKARDRASSGPQNPWEDADFDYKSWAGWSK